MRWVAAIFVERFGLVLLASIFAALLHYWGGLGLAAAFLVGFGFAFGTMAFRLLRREVVFKPYRLIIGIDYASLLADLGLGPSEPNFENFTFTAINNAMFARSDEPGYSSNLDVYKRIPGGPVWSPGLGEIDDRPIFFFRPTARAVTSSEFTSKRNGGSSTNHG